MSVHKYGPGYAWDLKLRRERSRRMVRRFITLAEIVLRSGGEVSFKWPRYCTGWRLPELVRFIAKWKLYTLAVDGCTTGLVDKNGVPIKKPWQFITSCQRQAVSLSMLRCAHGPDFKHALAEGSSTTKATEIYPVPLCRTLLGSLSAATGLHRQCPALSFNHTRIVSSSVRWRGSQPRTKDRLHLESRSFQVRSPA